MKSKRLPTWGAILAVGITCLASGCSDPENGTKPFVPPTPEQTKQFQDQQIKNIQDDPNIPADQKDGIIARYRTKPTQAQPAATAPGAGK
jgi:hypothetical protein